MQKSSKVMKEEMENFLRNNKGDKEPNKNLISNKFFCLDLNCLNLLRKSIVLKVDSYFILKIF